MTFLNALLHSLPPLTDSCSSALFLASDTRPSAILLAERNSTWRPFACRQNGSVTCCYLSYFPHKETRS